MHLAQDEIVPQSRRGEQYENCNSSPTEVCHASQQQANEEQKNKIRNDPATLCRQRRKVSQRLNYKSRGQSQRYECDHPYNNSQMVLLSLQPSPFVHTIQRIALSVQFCDEIVIGKIRIEMAPRRDKSCDEKARSEREQHGVL